MSKDGSRSSIRELQWYSQSWTWTTSPSSYPAPLYLNTTHLIAPNCTCNSHIYWELPSSCTSAHALPWQRLSPWSNTSQASLSAFWTRPKPWPIKTLIKGSIVSNILRPHPSNDPGPIKMPAWGTSRMSEKKYSLFQPILEGRKLSPSLCGGGEPNFYIHQLANLDRCPIWTNPSFLFFCNFSFPWLYWASAHFPP